MTKTLFDKTSGNINLYITVLITSFMGAVILTNTSSLIALVAIAALAVFITCFTKPEAALYFLVFSMLLSPEFGQRSAGGAGGSGVTIRLDDFLLVLIGLSWLARMAIFKNIGVLVKTSLNRPIFFYLFACIMATTIGIYIGNVKPLRGFFYVLKYFEYYVVYFILVNHLKDENQLRHLVIALLLTCFIINIIGILQIPSGERVTAPFEGKNGEPNTLGGYLVLMMALSMALAVHLKSIRAVIPLWGLSAFSLVTLLFTRSRGSYLAFIVMYLSIMILSRKKIFILLLVAALTAGPFVLPKVVVDRITYTFTQKAHKGQKKIGKVAIDTSTSARLQGWTDGFEAFLKRPIFGYGVTGFGFLDAQYLVVLVDTGIVGFAAFIGLLWALFKVGWGHYRKVRYRLHKGICLGFLAGFMAMLAHAVSTNTFVVVRIMEPFWFFAGLMVMCPAMERGQPENAIQKSPKNNIPGR